MTFLVMKGLWIPMSLDCEKKSNLTPPIPLLLKRWPGLDINLKMLL